MKSAFNAYIFAVGRRCSRIALRMPLPTLPGIASEALRDVGGRRGDTVKAWRLRGPSEAGIAANPDEGATRSKRNYSVLITEEAG